VSTDAWNPDAYARFMALRRPGIDELLAGIEPRPGMRIVDVGCGSGEITAEIHERFHAASTLGLERSPRMLKAAEARRRDGLSFAAGDINALAVAGPFDLVFSNGVLHYALDPFGALAKLAALLAPDGQLAIQAPRNPDSPPIALGYEIASQPKYRDHCRTVLGRPRTPSPREMADALFDLGFRDPVVRLRAHSHALPEGRLLFEWLRASFLSDFEALLPSALFVDFIAEYTDGFQALIPMDRPYHYVLQRAYAWARRAG
jgi:trans-aconitate 2-methyltransferase